MTQSKVEATEQSNRGGISEEIVTYMNFSLVAENNQIKRD